MPGALQGKGCTAWPLQGKKFYVVIHHPTFLLTHFLYGCSMWPARPSGLHSMLTCERFLNSFFCCSPPLTVIVQGLCSALRCLSSSCSTSGLGLGWPVLGSAATSCCWSCVVRHGTRCGRGWWWKPGPGGRICGRSSARDGCWGFSSPCWMWEATAAGRKWNKNPACASLAGSTPQLLDCEELGHFIPWDCSLCRRMGPAIQENQFSLLMQRSQTM